MSSSEKSKRRPQSYKNWAVALLAMAVVLLGIAMALRDDYDPVLYITQKSCEAVFSDSFKAKVSSGVTLNQYRGACRAEAWDLILASPDIVEECVTYGHTYMLQCLQKKETLFHGRYIDALGS